MPCKNTWRIEFTRAFKRLFAPLTKIGVVEWARRNVYLVDDERAGPFDTENFPYMREPLESLRYGSVQDIILCFGTQTGKTTILTVAVAYIVDIIHKTVFFAFPTKELAKRYSKTRLQPLFRASESLRSHLPENRDNYTNLEQQFDTCTLVLTGAGTPAQLASTPAPIIIADEIDKFKLATDREAGALQLLKERSKSFVSKKHLIASTPTTASGNIWSAYVGSDARKYFVACPHCGAEFTFEMSGLRWEGRSDESAEWDYRRVRRTAHYECPHCGGHIDERAKREIMRSGRWVASNGNAATGARGYHLNSLYSPTLTFGEIAEEFLRAQEDLSRMQNFVNSWLAEPWEDLCFGGEPAALKNCVCDYERGERKGTKAIIAVDVQMRDLRYNVRTYDTTGSYLADWGTAVDWTDIDELQNRYGAQLVGVDINFRARENEVYEAIGKRKTRGWLGILGAPDHNILTANAKLTHFNPMTRNRRINIGGIRLLTIKSSLYRSELALARTGARGNWHVYRGIERGYERELFAEVQAEKIVKGRREIYWKQVRTDNHQFDCETYQLAMAEYFKVSGRSIAGAAAGAAQRAINPAAAVPTAPRKKRQYKPLGN